MSLEAFTGWIKDLVGTNPAGGDPKSQGDDHIRGLKTTLKQQFSGFTEAVAVTVKASELNEVPATKVTADAALARASACLPKDGSEAMTGPLTAPDVAARRPGGATAQVSAGRDGGRYVVMFNSGTADEAGFDVMQDDQAGVIRFITVQLNAAGVMQNLQLGAAGKPILLAFAPTGASNGQDATTTAWVRNHTTKNRGASNGGDIGLTGSETLIAQVAQWIGSVAQPSLAAAAVSVNCPAASSVTLILRIRRVSDDAIMSEHRSSSSVGTALTACLSVSTFAAVADGGLYYATLHAAASNGGTISAGRGQLLAFG